MNKHSDVFLIFKKQTQIAFAKHTHTYTHVHTHTVKSVSQPSVSEHIEMDHSSTLSFPYSFKRSPTQPTWALLRTERWNCCNAPACDKFSGVQRPSGPAAALQFQLSRDMRGQLFHNTSVTFSGTVMLNMAHGCHCWVNCAGSSRSPNLYSTHPRTFNSVPTLDPVSVNFPKKHGRDT